MIDAGGDYRQPGVAHGGHGAGQIDQVHDLTAKEIAEHVGVVRQGQLRVIRVGFPHVLSIHRFQCSYTGNE